jgi:two-component system LytT family sensor kinase
VVILSLVLSVMLTMVFIRYNSKIRRLNHLLRQKGERILSQNRYIETQKKLLQIEAAKLGHENTIAHFEILKNQVNPHMLFNAMALLKSIIDKDKDTAKEFIDNLSDIFRQAFQLKKDLLVSVQEELHFVESYIHIICKQYENCLIVDMAIPDMIKNYYIPPFSLQLIVENVIKHNELSESNPVHLNIYYQDDMIHIENTVVKKEETKVSRSGVGHQNLIERYKLISEKEPRFFADEKIFSVCLPLFINE